MSTPRVSPQTDATAATWSQPLSERLKWLAGDGMRVAYLYETPDHSTFRYRVFNMVDALNGTSEPASAAWFYIDEWPYVEDLVSSLDVLVVCRCRYSHELDTLVSRARACGADVIYDIDDLVIDVDLIPLLVNALGVRGDDSWDFWYGYVGRLRAALDVCDRVVVTTTQLATMVRSATGKVVDVIPNFLNRQQLAVSDAIYNAKLSSGFSFDEPVYLGYFSGTPSHSKDFAIANHALACILEQESRVCLRTVGHVDVEGPLARFGARIEHHELQDYVRLQGLIGSTQVNLIPLQANVFTDCKSELKYFESAAVGTVSVASPTATYREAIIDGENGLLAYAHEWDEKLMRLVSDLLDSRDLYAELAQEAHRRALERYSWQHQVPAIMQVLWRS